MEREWGRIGADFAVRRRGDGRWEVLALDTEFVCPQVRAVAVPLHCALVHWLAFLADR